MHPSSDRPSTARKLPQVRCPSCGRQGPYDMANPWRPFCSEHCKTMDLGAWASERYRVESQTPPSEGQSPQDSDD